MGYLILIVCLSFIAAIASASYDTDFLAPIRNWEIERREFLKDLKPVKLCYTEDMASKIMKVINSHQCSAIGLPLDDAIQVEYDNWLSEDWFPDDQELEDMRLDEVM
jgi:hypothetical protein